MPETNEWRKSISAAWVRRLYTEHITNRKKYRAFISYKHVCSGGFAERLELALKAYAKPIWQPPIAIFRDEKYLKPGSDLPQMIANALDQSEFLIYLASPLAAASPWVRDELSRWCSEPARVPKLIIVLTEGSIAVEAVTKAIDWESTNVIPEVLHGVLKYVPLYLDCTGFASPQRQTLLDPDFKKVVNSISACFRGIDPIEMSGQEIISYRKNLRNRNLLIATAVLMLLLAATGGTIAQRRALEAATQSRISRASQLASEAAAAMGAQLPQRALLLASLAAEITRSKGEGVTAVAEQSLRDLLATTGGYGLTGRTGPVESVVFLKGGSELISLGVNGQAVLWRIGADGRGTEVHELISKEEGRLLTAQAFDGERAIRLVTRKGHVLTRNLDSRAEVLTDFHLSEFNYDNACDTAITRDKLLQMSNNGVLTIWDFAQAGKKPPAKRSVIQNAMRGCMISKDGRWVYAAGDGVAPVITRSDTDKVENQLPSGLARGSLVRVAFHPKSSQAALSMKDGRIYLVRLEPQHLGLWAQITGTPNENFLMAYSHSGIVLAIAGSSGTVRLWNVGGAFPSFLGSAKAPFEFFQEMDGRISFERDDTLLVISDGLRAAAAIPLTKQFVPLSAQVLHNHPSRNDISGDRPTPYAFEPRKSILVTAGNDHSATVWSLENNRLTQRNQVLLGHDKGILTVQFSPDGKWLLSAGYDGVIRLWPVDPPHWIASPSVLSSSSSDFLLNDGVPNPHGGVLFARFIVGEEWFESHGENSRARFGALDRLGRLLRTLSPSIEGDLSGVEDAEAERLRQASFYPPLRQRLREELVRKYHLPQLDPDLPFAFAADQTMLAEAMRDGTIRLWDLLKTPAEPKIYRGLTEPSVSLDLDSRKGRLAGVTDKGQFGMWRVGRPQTPEFNGNLVALLAGARLLGAEKGVTAKRELFEAGDLRPTIGFLGGGRWLVVNHAHLLDLQSSGPSAWSVPAGAHERASLGDCCLLQLFPDRFELWRVNADSGEPSALSLDRPMADVTAYAYSDLHRRLALGFLDGRVLLLTMNPADAVEHVARVTSHDFPIRSLALSSDANIIAAGSQAGITMTEMSNDLSVARHIRLKGHRGNVEVLSFSEEGHWLLSGGEDDSVHVFPVKAEQLLDLACAVAGRSFSEAEMSRVPETQALKVCSSRLLRPR